MPGDQSLNQTAAKREGGVSAGRTEPGKIFEAMTAPVMRRNLVPAKQRKQRVYILPQTATEGPSFCVAVIVRCLSLH